MSSRQPVNIPIHGSRPVLRPLLQEKIAYELRIQIRRDAWRLAENLKGIAEIEFIGRLCIEKRARAYQISHTPETARGLIPKCEGKVPVKVRKAIFTPAPPGTKNQFFVACFR